MIGWERIQGGKANLKRWVLSFERNVKTDNELRVSGGREFQTVAYRGGAEGAIRPGRHSERGGKKGEKEKKKKRKGKRKREREKGKKKEKENMGEACNSSKIKMEHLSCGAPMHVKPNILVPQAIHADAWLGYIYVLLHRAPKFIGSYTL